MKPLAIVFLAALTASASADPARWSAVEVASGRGERGPWRQNDSRYDYVDDPTVSLDERGGAAVAWVDQGRKDVLLRRFSADGRPQGKQVNVSRSPATFSWLPRIARSGDTLFLLWQEIIFSGGSHGGDILFARSDDGGASFSEPLNLSRSVGGDGKGRITREHWDNGSLDIVAGADGAVYAAWTEYEGALWLAVSSDRGRSFSPPRRIGGEPERPARAPALALGNDSVLYVAWTVGEDRAADIRIARSTDGGARFSAPAIVHRSQAYSDSPKLALDPAGTLHVAWSEANRILYARSTDGARGFEPPRDVSGSGAGYPSLALAGKSVFVLWERMAERGRRPQGLALAVSVDGGNAFAQVDDLPAMTDGGAPNGSFQGLLMKKLAVNARGEIAVVNSSLRDGERSRVWLVRGAAP
jgi:hypothetical protein